MPKEINNDVMSENFDVIVIFPIYGQFGAIRDLDSGCIGLKLVFSFIVTFYLTKTENRTKRSLTHLSHYCFELKYYLCHKR